jgi:hypothetical protein
MTSVFDVSGNNLPKITLTTPAKEVLNVCHQIISRKKNTFDGFAGDGDAGATGYNKAIVELEDELYRILCDLENVRDGLTLKLKENEQV